MHELTCAGCGESFEAKSPRAKWCSAACRKRFQRSSATTGSEAETPVEVDETHSLVASVTRELEEAGRAQTFHGQLAIQLAKRLASPDESGISSLSKELRTVMATALEGAAPAPAEPEEDLEDDEVAKARKAREDARQAAGLA